MAFLYNGIVMCGRFVRHTSVREFTKLAGLLTDGRQAGEISPSWNIAPGRACVLVRHQLDHDSSDIVSLLWGLIPNWAKERPPTRPINARIETAADKPMFKRLVRYRRALIAADGWYEWQQTPSGKVPHFIRFKDGRPFFFGGIWDEWKGPDGIAVPTFAILTRPAIEGITEIHDRMPVIVPPHYYAAWLDKSISDPSDVLEICSLDTPPSELINGYPVSGAVNKATEDGPQLIAKSNS